jgi:hypothetical protein
MKPARCSEGGRRNWLALGSAGTIVAVVAALMLVAIPRAGALSGSTAMSDWTARPDQPAARANASMAFDPTTGNVVLFGGNGNTGKLSDTWAFDGTDWVQLTPAHTPPALGGASMAFDATTGDLVLFGGSDASSFLSDTWAFDGTDWTELTPAHHPPARFNASMAFDDTTGDLVLFGGSDASSLLSDT